MRVGRQSRGARLARSHASRAPAPQRPGGRRGCNSPGPPPAGRRWAAAVRARDASSASRGTGSTPLRSNPGRLPNRPHPVAARVRLGFGRFCSSPLVGGWRSNLRRTPSNPYWCPGRPNGPGHASPISSCNPEALAAYRLAKPNDDALDAPNRPSSTYDYLLVSTAALLPAFQALIERRERAGLRVKAETMEHIVTQFRGRDPAEQLRNGIRFAYTNWGIQHVLLGGDSSSVPTRLAMCIATCQRPSRSLPATSISPALTAPGTGTPIVAGVKRPTATTVERSTCWRSSTSSGAGGYHRRGGGVR